MTTTQQQRCRELNYTYHFHCNKVNTWIKKVSSCPDTISDLTRELLRMLQTLDLANAQPAKLIEAIQVFKTHLKPCYTARAAFFERCVQTLPTQDRNWDSDFKHAFAREQYERAWVAGERIFRNISELVAVSVVKKKKPKKPKKKSITIEDTFQSLTLNDEESSSESETEQQQQPSSSSTIKRSKKKKKKKSAAAVVEDWQLEFKEFFANNLEDSDHLVERITNELQTVSIESIRDLLSKVDFDIDKNLRPSSRANYLQWYILFPHLTLKLTSLQSLIVHSRASLAVIFGVLTYLEEKMAAAPTSNIKAQREQIFRSNLLLTDTVMMHFITVLQRIDENTHTLLRNPLLGTDWSQLCIDELYRRAAGRLTDGVDNVMNGMANALDIWMALCHYDYKFYKCLEQTMQGAFNVLRWTSELLKWQRVMTRAEKHEFVRNIISTKEEKVMPMTNMSSVMNVITESLQSGKNHTSVPKNLIMGIAPLPQVDANVVLARYCIMKNSRGLRTTIPCIVYPLFAEQTGHVTLQLVIDDRLRSLVSLMESFFVQDYMPASASRTLLLGGKLLLSLAVYYRRIESQYCQIHYINVPQT